MGAVVPFGCTKFPTRMGETGSRLSVIVLASRGDQQGHMVPNEPSAFFNQKCDIDRTWFASNGRLATATRCRQRATPNCIGKQGVTPGSIISRGGLIWCCDHDRSPLGVICKYAVLSPREISGMKFTRVFALGRRHADRRSCLLQCKEALRKHYNR